MPRQTQCWPLAALLLLAAPLAACGPGLGGLRDESLLDRCGDVMTRAFPGGDITITHKALSPAPAKSMATLLAEVEGERGDVPANGVVRRHVAVECRFDDGILTGFHWTAGPVR